MTKLKKTGRCKVCGHSQKPVIELRCANGPRRAPQIAREFGLSKDSVLRHWNNHVSAERKARLVINTGFAADPGVNLEALKRSESEGALQYLVNERTRLMRVADHCETISDYVNSIRASGGILKVTELIAKLLGDLKLGSTTINQNFLLSPDWFQLRRVIAQSLRPFPDAQLAVLSALREHERLAGTEVSEARTVDITRTAIEHAEAAGC